MQIEELQQFIKKESKRLQNLDITKKIEDREKRNYVRTIKLTEELGELCYHVLSSSNKQRAGKRNHRKKELSEEFADVIICTLLLADNMKIDVQKGLISKIKKIEARYKN